MLGSLNLWKSHFRDFLHNCFLFVGETEASKIIIGFDSHGILAYSKQFRFQVRALKNLGDIHTIAYDVKNKKIYYSLSYDAKWMNPNGSGKVTLFSSSQCELTHRQPILLLHTKH